MISTTDISERTNLKSKLLTTIYEVFEDFARRLPHACTVGCAACCTQNIFMTTLEGYRILNRLTEPEQAGIIARLESIPAEGKRYIPTITTNQLAFYCLKQMEPPPEEAGAALDPCPLLENNQCTIYEDRPFGCRSFFSTRRCNPLRPAEVDPLLITVTNVMFQIIEHVDNAGQVGNMIDILTGLGTNQRIEEYASDVSLEDLKATIKARRIPGFLIPPEHKAVVVALLRTMNETVIDGVTFQDLMKELD
ncbi:MAG: YkgJ family cysteine cluster protein [Deltaproteobacteria bacterium]|nr:YkgJ family cysteine cluster protein [Deltaproteobacteria bacterium]